MTKYENNVHFFFINFSCVPWGSLLYMLNHKKTFFFLVVKGGYFFYVRLPLGHVII